MPDYDTRFQEAQEAQADEYRATLRDILSGGEQWYEIWWLNDKHPSGACWATEGESEAYRYTSVDQAQKRMIELEEIDKANDDSRWYEVIEVHVSMRRVPDPRYEGGPEYDSGTPYQGNTEDGPEDTWESRGGRHTVLGCQCGAAHHEPTG